MVFSPQEIVRLGATPEARSALDVPDFPGRWERVGGLCSLRPQESWAALPHVQEHRLDGTITRNTSVLLDPAPPGQLHCVTSEGTIHIVV